jgi:diguanylate cyclase (GGDEF)-like protein
MTAKRDPETSTDPALVKTLAKALIESERIKAIVDKAASDISCVTRAITEAMLECPNLRAVEGALQQISEAKSKVRLVSSKLSAITLDLESEARDRDMLDYRFAAALEQHDSTRHASLHDTLTGLPNRALFNDRLQVAVSHAGREGLSLAIMFVDLDGFKAINDSFGHATGDRVLQIIAKRLTSHTRDDDTVSRHGGDEFLYLANHVVDVNNIDLIAQKLLREIQAPMDITVPKRENFRASLTASIGIAVFPKDGRTPDLLIRNADAAMYQAKGSKCRVSFVP